MTRPKVPPEQRQRTAQACESCKRRKQKCNGLCPCNTCEKRNFSCIYADREPGSPADSGPPAKRRAVQDGDAESPYADDNSSSKTPSNGNHHPSPLAPARRKSSAASRPVEKSHEGRPDPLKQETPYKSPGARPSIEGVSAFQQLPTSNANGEHLQARSRGTTVGSGPDEEAIIYSQSRMLQDPTGRVLYIGDSATLSFLQLLRMMVETVAGPSSFTNDPRRHKIVEGQYSLPPGFRHTHLLPDKQTARVLADTFFINTHGLLQVFERDRFLEEMEACYADPFQVQPPWLCLLNMVFAIGLTMATPLSGSPEALIIDKLRSEHLDRAEVFYLNAKSLNDPMNGLEDQDFWSVQALLLMSVYMLAKSKRNTAFALLGMAARSAHALGLHREETMVIFSPEEQTQRKNLWRSIFVMDRLLSCSLGRPTAISEDDCSGDTLRPSLGSPEQPYLINPSPDFNQTGPCALEAAVRSCSVIGIILRKVYQQRKINTRLAQEIADICKSWPRALPSILHWRQAANASPSQGVAILHVNLFYCHSIILLTRPFFLYILNLETQRHVNQSQPGVRGPRPYLRMEKFSEACVIASTHTILLVQNAFDVGHLSRRNPAVIYFLFAATLVILANEFAGLYRVDAADTCILNAVTIMNYCAESDQQASRLVYILSTFRDVVAQQRMQRKQSQVDNNNLPSISSQLYGVTAPNQQNTQAPSVGLANSTDPMSATPRLHQVPIHIYPGMHTAPLDATPPAFQPPHLAHSNSLPTQLSPPQTDFSVHLSPIQDPPASAPGSDTYNLGTSGLSSPSKPPSLSTMLDLSALDNTRVPSLHSEESGLDEHIDFDALWAWPSNTPAMGSPRPGGEGNANIGGGQGVIGGAGEGAPVPLFGISHEGRGGRE
ncbi:fungal specific transcription factor domain-containing protein [Stagonosporopsis vannaccii]|nr:fungal specific transcription factor domain-containing protein [Stagonosporopsis vannaccii]